MDYLGYALDWEEKQEEGLALPAKRLPAAAAQYDLLRGEHPLAYKIPPDFYTRPAFADPQNPNISNELQPRPMGCVHGHNTLADSAFTSLINVDVNIPISPLFVRDLAGRTIHIGYGPEAKTIHEWEAYDLPKNPVAPAVVFPKNCEHVTENTLGADIIENVFFLKFRTLDMAFDYMGMPSGSEEEVVAGIYNNANLYPYKLRLDTFYTDGYKLPQTQMLYARQDISAAKSNQTAKKFMEKWQNRPEGQTYQDFYEKNGAEEGLDTLFEAGCTVIPTFEGCNGYHAVSADFMLEDYKPGRAVHGLHAIEKEIPSDLPLDTILEVLEPGYITKTEIHPAKVLVSDGSGYVSPHADTSPPPLVPNLHLPHQRTTANWWACWLPTHPEHFEPPAIWGWDAQTGRFLQQRGPLWDPLHYYYSCTDTIIKACQNPRPDNQWLIDVPDIMMDKFHPIVPIKGFDTISEEALNRRQERNTLPRSAVTRVYSGKQTAAIGYHPLPIQFEYELDSFWFPELSPINRLPSMCPEPLFERLATVISPNVTVQEYLDSVNGPEEAPWLKDEMLCTPPSNNPVEDFPHLVRYTEPDLPIEDVLALSAGLFLEMVPDVLLTQGAQEVWPSIDDYDDLEPISPGLFNAVWDMREEAVKLRQFRHKLYQRNPSLYAYAWWHCLPISQLEQFFEDYELNKAPKDDVRTSAALKASLVSAPTTTEDEMPHYYQPKNKI